MAANPPGKSSTRSSPAPASKSARAGSSRPGPAAPVADAKALPWPALLPLGNHHGKPAIPLMRPVILVGSRTNAHLHLLSRQVSKAHALILVGDGRVYVRDLASRTHIYVNAVEVREADLQSGDLLQIGAFKFQYQAAAGMKQKPREQAAPAMIEYGGELPLKIDGRVLLIGRRPTCDLVLPDESVSTTHAIIFEMGGKRYVRDLGSRAGTVANGKPEKQVELRFNDRLQIGDNDLQYLPAAGRMVSAGPLADDPMDEFENLVGTAPLGHESAEAEIELPPAARPVAPPVPLPTAKAAPQEPPKAVPRSTPSAIPAGPAESDQWAIPLAPAADLSQADEELDPVSHDTHALPIDEIAPPYAQLSPQVVDEPPPAAEADDLHFPEGAPLDLAPAPERHTAEQDLDDLRGRQTLVSDNLLSERLQGTGADDAMSAAAREALELAGPEAQRDAALGRAARTENIEWGDEPAAPAAPVEEIAPAAEAPATAPAPAAEDLEPKKRRWFSFGKKEKSPPPVVPAPPPTAQLLPAESSEIEAEDIFADPAPAAPAADHAFDLEPIDLEPIDLQPHEAPAAEAQGKSPAPATDRAFDLEPIDLEPQKAPAAEAEVESSAPAAAPIDEDGLTNEAPAEHSPVAPTEPADEDWLTAEVPAEGALVAQTPVAPPPPPLIEVNEPAADRAPAAPTAEYEATHDAAALAPVAVPQAEPLELLAGPDDFAPAHEALPPHADHESAIDPAHDVQLAQDIQLVPEAQAAPHLPAATSHEPEPSAEGHADEDELLSLLNAPPAPADPAAPPHAHAPLDVEHFEPSHPAPAALAPLVVTPATDPLVERAPSDQAHHAHHADHVDAAIVSALTGTDAPATWPAADAHDEFEAHLLEQPAQVAPPAPAVPAAEQSFEEAIAEAQALLGHGPASAAAAPPPNTTEEVVEPTEPTHESALPLAADTDANVPPQWAMPADAPPAADDAHPDELSDSSFGRMVEDFAGPSTGPLLEEPHGQPAAPTPQLRQEVDDLERELFGEEVRAAAEHAPESIEESPALQEEESQRRPLEGPTLLSFSDRPEGGAFPLESPTPPDLAKDGLLPLEATQPTEPPLPPAPAHHAAGATLDPWADEEDDAPIIPADATHAGEDWLAEEPPAAPRRGIFARSEPTEAAEAPAAAATDEAAAHPDELPPPADVPHPADADEGPAEPFAHDIPQVLDDEEDLLDAPPHGTLAPGHAAPPAGAAHALAESIAAAPQVSPAADVPAHDAAAGETADPFDAPRDDLDSEESWTAHAATPAAQVHHALAPDLPAHAESEALPHGVEADDFAPEPTDEAASLAAEAEDFAPAGHEPSPAAVEAAPPEHEGNDLAPEPTEADDFAPAVIHETSPVADESALHEDDEADHLAPTADAPLARVEPSLPAVAPADGGQSQSFYDMGAAGFLGGLPLQLNELPPPPPKFGQVAVKLDAPKPAPAAEARPAEADTSAASASEAPGADALDADETDEPIVAKSRLFLPKGVTPPRPIRRPPPMPEGGASLLGGAIGGAAAHGADPFGGFSHDLSGDPFFGLNATKPPPRPAPRPAAPAALDAQSAAMADHLADELGGPAEVDAPDHETPAAPHDPYAAEADGGAPHAGLAGEPFDFDAEANELFDEGAVDDTTFGEPAHEGEADDAAVDDTTFGEPTTAGMADDAEGTNGHYAADDAAAAALAASPARASIVRRGAPAAPAPPRRAGTPAGRMPPAQYAQAVVGGYAPSRREPRQTPHRSKTAPLVLVMLLLMAAAAGGIYYLIKVQRTVNGPISFGNVESLNREEAGHFQTIQTEMAKSADMRTAARNALKLTHPNAGFGFLGPSFDQIEWAKNFAVKWPAAAGEVPSTMVLSYSGTDPDDVYRLDALRKAIYKLNESRSVEQRAAQIDADKALAAKQDDERKLAGLKAELERARERLNAAPSSEEVRALKAECDKLDAALSAATQTARQAEDEVRRAEAQTPTTLPADSLANDPANAAPATNPAADPQLAEMQKTLADLNGKLTAARRTADADAEQARAALDAAMEDFNRNLGSMQATMKDSPELAAYVSAATNLQQTTRKLAGDLLERQQKSHEHLLEMKKRLDERIETRRKEVWDNDPKLRELRDDLAFRRKGLNASINSGYDVDMAKIRAEMADTEARIEARKAQLAKDTYLDEFAKELEQDIVASEKQLESDKQFNDALMKDMEKTFNTSAQVVAKLPREQQAAAAALADRVKNMNAARKAYADRLEAKNADRNEALKGLESQAKALAAKLDERKKQLASDNVKQLTEQEKEQRKLALEKQREEAERAKADEAKAYAAYRAKAKELRDKQQDQQDAHGQAELAERLSKQVQATEEDRQHASDTYEQKRAEAKKVVYPLPLAGEVTEASAADPRGHYALAAVGGIAVVFSLLILMSHRGDARRAHRELPEYSGHEMAAAGGNGHNGDSAEEHADAG